MISAEDPTLAVPDGWTETSYETGTYGPDDRDGIEATLDREDASLEVLPVSYRRSEGSETVESLTGEYRATRDDPAGEGRVPETTAFATVARFAPYERERTAIVTVAADADDALAVAAWLAAGSGDAADLQRNVRLHAGNLPPSRKEPALPDDDVLATLFAAEPERCVLTGKETRSHRIRVPYRYVPLLDGARETARGVPRFPSTVRGLVGVVSHAAWEDQGLDGVAFDEPLERVEPGRYRLDPDVAGALDAAEAERFALARLGDWPDSGA